MLKETIKYLSILMACLFVHSLPGQQYNFIRYSVQEGLPQSQVFAGFQDAKGYIWYGTQGGGVARFDGVEFHAFSTKDGLPSNYINTIIEDNQGHICIGTTRGVAVFNGRKWENIAAMNAHALLQKNDSTLWIGSSNGVFAYSTTQKVLEKLSFDPRLDKLGINDFLATDKGVWVASNAGLWHINQTVDRYTLRNGLNGGVVQSLIKDVNGLLWVASYDGGISVFDEKKGTFLPFQNTDNIQKALTLFLDDTGDVWVGTRDQGISIFHRRDSTWTTINERKGLPHNHVRQIFKDSWNNIWVCTSGGGVGKYLGQFFVQYNTRNGLHGKYIYALTTDSEGDLWVSASNNGLASFDGRTFKKSNIDSGYINVKSKAILSTDDGLWVGTEGKGLIKMDSTGYQIITQKEGLSSDWIRGLVEDDNGKIWVATTTKGIVEMEKNGDVNYKFTRHKSDLPDLYISTINKSSDGRIWFATQFGNMGFFENGKVAKTYGVEDGLPNVSIRAMVFDAEGNIWLGTAGRGIYRADMETNPIQFYPVEMEKPLYSDNIYLLVFDENGNLWAGSEGGVDKLLLNEAGVVVEAQHFGRDEGFLGIETCQNAALLDDAGNLWFGTMNGLMKHSPSTEMHTASVPKIHFNKISLFYQPLVETKYRDFVEADGTLKSGLHLPYRQNHLNFEFKALNLSNPKGIKYRWRLQGIESSWSPFSTKESVDYSNLIPGDYLFEVQAMSGGDQLSDIISTGFSIKKPFWQLLWAQVLTVLVLLSLIFGWFWNWKRKLERKELAKRAQLEMKNHVLQLEQKALQLQMNPHFIFNALNSIQSLVATKDFKTARTQINNFATLMRGILSNSKQEKISLKEEMTVLKNYLGMEQFCQPVPFNFRIDLDENISIEEVEIPPMILQPFVENAVIHGIAHRQSEGLIEIGFSMEHNILTCKIKDNGVGRKRAAELKQSGKRGHQSISMEVTRERLEALSIDGNYQPLVIEDLLSDDGQINGTQITVKIPVVTWQ